MALWSLGSEGEAGGEGRGGKERAGDGGGASGEKRIGGVVFVLVLGLSGMQGGQGKEKCIFDRFLCI